MGANSRGYDGRAYTHYVKEERLKMTVEEYVRIKGVLLAKAVSYAEAIDKHEITRAAKELCDAAIAFNKAKEELIQRGR
jgi:hypothetical protein